MDLFSYIDRGIYSRQLAHIWRLYPRKSVLILFFEEFRDHPLEAFTETCRFLGISEGLTVPPLGDRINRAMRIRSRRLRRLMKRAPKPIQDLVGRVNARGWTYPELDAVTRHRLDRMYESERTMLRNWLAGICQAGAVPASPHRSREIASPA